VARGCVTRFNLCQARYAFITRTSRGRNSGTHNSRSMHNVLHLHHGSLLRFA
jgi:hypothetical protein